MFLGGLKKSVINLHLLQTYCISSKEPICDLQLGQIGNGLSFSQNNPLYFVKLSGEVVSVPFSKVSKRFSSSVTLLGNAISSFHTGIFSNKVFNSLNTDIITPHKLIIA